MSCDVATAGRLDADAIADALNRMQSTDEPPLEQMLFVGPGAPQTHRAVVAWADPAPLLTEACALFDHFGLQVANQYPVTVPGHPLTVSAFDFVAPDKWRAGSENKVADAFAARSAHGFRIDDHARLIISAGITWRDVVLVRSAGRFMRQAGLAMSEAYVLDTLTDHTDFVATLVDLFAARFDPQLCDRESRVADAQSRLESLIEATTSVDEDRILRAFTSFMSATLRTNWFQRGSDGRPKRHASFLIDSSMLHPRGPIVPFREIFVDSEDVEGIHARSGPVARGGLRFSDRPEDYRTEVLGLMKTQTVKNSPIVPVGAKGAFVRKDPMVSAEQCYRTFVAGLLDLTDNLLDDRVCPPEHTVTYGGNDTYLVVAADKGTARFSDVANELAVDRGFWLGDAFASGGSAGYDHKKMGITARGAWVSVRAHFADLGRDADAEPITVVGIGDMSGDVFGNGMLLSPNLKLLAAFDHRHIFVDPDPDPRAGYAERTRLAAMPASSWDDYDRTELSPGGGVWSRNAKRIGLPVAAREALGITAETVTPNDVIRAILTADADLLWNGGIGTYVKSARENNTDAADPANDAIRVNADQLRVTVIGEGGNLGLTQRARVEYALAGGRINADFIDNAAGVASSDREVNLKIALQSALLAQRVSAAGRDEMLAGCQAEVAAAVLRGCENQVRAISLAEAQAAQLLNRHERLIDNLEQVSGISRTAEMLPSRVELVSRTRAGRGLTRPEIAVLLAHSKNVVRDELLDSAVPDDPIFSTTLRDYFPTSFRIHLDADISCHRLAREIIATQIADDLINHVGPGLIYQLDERLGVPTPMVAAAYTVVRHLFGIDEMWREALEQTAGGPAQRNVALHSVQHFIEHTAGRLLLRHGGNLDIGTTIAAYRRHVDTLHHHRRDFGDRWPRLRPDSLDLSRTATRMGVDITAVAHVFLAIDDQLDLDWIECGLRAHITPTWWDAMGTSAIRDQLADTRHQLTAAVLSLAADPEEARRLWRDGAATALARFSRMRAELGRDNVVDVARGASVLAELALLLRHTHGLAR
ncbi:NAD-glutamate dehydrogenase domain-containing protein [Mycolicibacterium neworleansense]|uniref:NAD-glutamate dehydrogenase n=1 Tax=Mycolicibacterium neworleansense TaxID=146018 RepID=A0A0H5RP62_9MYCO|nr:NAD-glutamate dehydrogenase domain-containing protein [Mycolicibacterium neworleansense]MCV7365167.1 NAD-glutamate dehydrogenase [Mycolicibacterium neworleansense]CRZ15970.1 NAD-glutamate dehydrogenase [Mycolicibacterium neworleansense]